MLASRLAQPLKLQESLLLIKLEQKRGCHFEINQVNQVDEDLYQLLIRAR